MKLDTWTVGQGTRTVALVHGASKDADVWRDFARILADEHGFTVVLLDLRGHGRSPRAASYRVADFAGDLVDTLPVGLDCLIGQSLGGVACAWANARLQPKRYIGLDPAFAIDARTAFAALALGVLGPMPARIAGWLLRLPGASTTGAAPDTPQRLQAMLARWDSSMMVPLVRSARREPFPVGPPAVPSTLVLAENSAVVSDDMARALRSAGWDVRVKPGAVHDLHLQDPRGVINLLDDVLRVSRDQGT